MEEARCLMWSSTGKPHRTPISSRPMYVFGDSWEEEQALADDSAVGALGGYVWPPRSYSCTFCRREFRSAQALGGHMNVHRRDRARLKQADSLQPSDVVLPPEDRGTLSYGNPNPQLPGGGVTRVLSPPRARAISTEENTRTILCFLPQPAEENELVFSGPAASWSSLILAGKPDREISVSARKFKNGVDVLKCGAAEGEDRVTEDAPVGLDLLVCRKQTSEDVVAGSCKRRRVGEKPSTLIPTLIGGDELDLELRLG